MNKIEWAKQYEQIVAKLNAAHDDDRAQLDLLTEKVEGWNQSGGTWLTAADYAPWRATGEKVRQLQEQFDSLLSSEPLA